jgi:sugar phosphate isomerase/epimerase
MIVPGVKIGIQTRSLRQPIRQAINSAARLGAAGVEIDARTELRPADVSSTGLREFLKLLSDRNLRVAAVAFPTRRGYDVPDDLERRVLATQEAMRFVADLRSDVLILRIDHVPTEAETAGWTRAVEALTALGLFGERIGVRPALQPVGPSPTEVLRLIQALPSHLVGVDLHPSALIFSGHSPVEAVELLGPHIIHVHACDAVPNPGSRQVTEVELGRGAADMPELLGRLTEFDYRGWVTIERRDSANSIEEIGNAVEYLRSL